MLIGLLRRRTITLHYPNKQLLSFCSLPSSYIWLTRTTVCFQVLQGLVLATKPGSRCSRLSHHLSPLQSSPGPLPVSAHVATALRGDVAVLCWWLWQGQTTLRHPPSCRNTGTGWFWRMWGSFKSPKPQDPARPTRRDGREMQAEAHGESPGDAYPKRRGCQFPFQLGLGRAWPSFSQPPSFHNHPRLCSKYKGTCGFSSSFIFIFPPSGTTHSLLCIKNISEVKVHSCQNRINTTHKSGFELLVCCNNRLLASVSLGPWFYLMTWKLLVQTQAWKATHSISRTTKSVTQLGSDPGSTTDCLAGGHLTSDPRLLTYKRVWHVSPASCLPCPHLPLGSCQNDFLHTNST